MTRIMKTVVLLAALALPTSALACAITDFSAWANCEGWCADVEVWFRGTDRNGVLHWTATLTDKSGAVVAEDSGSEALLHDSYTWKDYQFCGAFDPPCGKYTARIVVTLTGDGVGDPANPATTQREYVSDLLDCDCPVDVCNFTPGYWKNHPEAWPVMELMMGGVTYCQDTLIDIMQTPVRGDATIILAHHLIAAKLNVINGSDPGINDTIMAADDLLVMYPLCGDPEGEARDMILDAKKHLAAYNEMGCGEPDPCPDKALPTVTDETWSDLKATYR